MRGAYLYISVQAFGLREGSATYFVNDEIITPQLNIPYEPSKLKLTETSFTCQFMGLVLSRDFCPKQDNN